MEITDQIHPVDLCGCGKPLKHVGICSARLEKASHTRAANKQKRANQMVASRTIWSQINFFHFVCEGDHVKLQQNGATMEQMAEALRMLGDAIGYEISMRAK